MLILACINLCFFETVVKPPGLSSPCKMKRCQGLLTAFGLGFAPNVQCQVRADLCLCTYSVDLFLHRAIAPVAPLHGIRRWRAAACRRET